MAAAAGDRLSNLSDDLLIHILSYAPAREAASTAALSCRWRHRLWLEASAVNLDYRSYPNADGAYELRWQAESDAQHARALHRSFSTKPAAGARRVAVVMRGDTMHDRVLRAATGNEEEEDEEEEDGVEEIFLDCTKDAAAPLTESPSWYSYDLSLQLLPSAALRILDLKGCNLTRGWRRWQAFFFPCLEALRLRRCSADLEVLQAMVDAAPKLADLRIESCTLQGCADPARLRCPAPAVSVVDIYLPSPKDNMRGCAVELHAPRVRCAKVVQTLSWNADAVLISFKPPPAAMAAVGRVHLELHHATAPLRCVDPRVFRRTKALKLTVYSMADLNLNANDDLPPVFFLELERLEIEELTTCGSPASRAAAVASLLRRCPAVRELRLRSRWRDYLCDTVPDPAVRAAAMADFSPCRSVNRDEDDEAECCKKTLHELPELNCSSCIPPLNSLRRVAMDFDAEELSCVHVRLLRFLAHNAVLLEEVAVAGGKGYDSSNIDRKVSTWMMRSAGRSPSPSTMLEEEQEDNLQRVCRCSCCTRAARLSSSRPARSVPEWPPSLLEFPWLEREDTSPPWPSDVGGGGNGLDYYLYLYDDDDRTSPPPRKRNKVWSSPEWLTVKLPKAKKGLVVTAPSWIVRGGELEAEGGICYERSSAASLPAADDPWYWPPPPSLSEFPPLVPAPPFLSSESTESPARAWPEPEPGESSWPDDAADILTPPWSTSDGEDEWHYMEDDEEEDWISARHLVHVDRKRKKVWGTPECFTVKLPKANQKGGVAGEGWIRRRRGGGGGGATRRCRRWLGEDEGGQSCRAPRWPPSLLEFPPLVPAGCSSSKLNGFFI